MDTKTRRLIFKRLQKHNPNPTTEVNYHSVFELLIAVILSAHTTDVSVNKATAQLFPIANTAEKIYALGVNDLKQYIKKVGLYNAKAQNIIKTCHMLITQFNSKVPMDRESLESLAGVGRKTANVILNMAFGEHTIAVDTHIFRVANRTGLAPGKNVLQVEKELLKTMPVEFVKDAHHWLLLHGRYICVARKPKCPHCFINDLCEYPDKTPESLAIKKRYNE